MEKGQIIGSYRLLEKLGEGAAGEVFLATPTGPNDFAKPGEPLAVKIYKPAILREKNQLDRIKREFVVGSQVCHSNLAKIYEYSLEANPYLVMEYVDGITLDRWLQLFHPISGLLLLRIVDQLTSAIARLHQDGIIHRDLKPANVMMSSDFQVKVMDFGVVRVTTESVDVQATPSDKFLGTIRNAAPEMLFGAEYDQRADLYSLGTIVYFLLYGEQVFSDENQFARLIERIRNTDPSPAGDTRTDDVVRNALAQITSRLLLKKQDERLGSIAELTQSLELVHKNLPETGDLEPIHGYMATALTGLDGDARDAIMFTSGKISEVAKHFELYVYEPRKATDPLLHPDVEATAVYLLDRKRVLSADLVFILANKPSFGVGQELEISSSCSKPTVIIARVGTSISRMMLGCFANLLEEPIYYNTPEDLATNLRRALQRNINRVREWKRKSQRIPKIELGQKLAQLRETNSYSREDLASALGFSLRLLDAIEEGKIENIGIVMLAKISQLFAIPLGELIAREKFGGKKASSGVATGDPNLRRLESVAREAGWSAGHYFDMVADYRKQVAADGETPNISAEHWMARHAALEKRRLKEQQPGLFDSQK